MLWLLAAFCFLPLLSPIVARRDPAAARAHAGQPVPQLVGDRRSSTTPTSWSSLVCAAVDGAARLDRWASAGVGRTAAGRGRRGGRPASGRGTAIGRREPGRRDAGRARPGAGRAAVDQRQLALRVRRGHGRGRGGPRPVPRSARPARRASTSETPRRTRPPRPTPGPERRHGRGEPSSAPQLAARDYVLLWDGDGQHPPLLPQVVANMTQRQFTFSSLARQQIASVRAATSSRATGSSSGATGTLCCTARPSRRAARRAEERHRAGRAGLPEGDPR